MTPLLLLTGLLACSPDEFRLTYYWTVSPEDADMTSPEVDIRDEDGEVLARIPLDLAERIALEGSGFLPDGRLINLACSCPWPDSRFYVVDQSVSPYGDDARGEPLVPFLSAAIDPDVIKLGSTVYIERFDGLALPDGTTHDGCFLAADTSHSFSGEHIDLYTGTQPAYAEVDAALGEISRVLLSVGDPACDPLRRTTR